MPRRKVLTPKQIAFLTFSMKHPVYHGDRPNPALPLRGAVAQTIADSLLKRGLISEVGYITPTGEAALRAVESIAA